MRRCDRFGVLLCPEHLELEPGAICPALLGDPLCRDRLHNPMEVLGNPICMRPQCHVDLLRTFELRHDRRGLLEYGAEFSCLSRKQIGDVDDVAPGLDDQRPDPSGPMQWSTNHASVE